MSEEHPPYGPPRLKPETPETPDFDQIARGPTLTGLPDLPPDAIGATINGVHYTREQYEVLRAQGTTMPETPDFDSIARLLLDRIVEVLPGEDGKRVAALRKELFLPGVVEQLRDVWNARGAADLQAIRDLPVGVGVARTDVIDQFRALDR